MTVLILAQDADAPTDHLVAELTRRRVPVFRADSSWFPRRLILDAELAPDGRWRGSLATEHRSVQLSEIRSIWYRDPAAFTFAEGLTDVERAYAHREARLGFGGVLAALRGVTWANMPNRAADAMYKPLQLATAAACGLRIPPTLVTNSAAAVRRFAEVSDTGGVVQKSFGPNSVTEGGQTKIAYTRRLDDDALADLRGVDATATQLQGWVDKTSEARLVVVGDQLFTIRITAASAASRVDWRADFDALGYEWIDTPAEVDHGVRAYMKTLGLAYAALDFGIDAHDRYWFYESNGGGQYGWLEAQTGAPITAALADLLQGERR